jgi:hypothetical protein
VWDPHRKKIPAEGERHPINLKERRGSSWPVFCSLLYEGKEMEREAIKRACKRGEEALVGVGDSVISLSRSVDG